LMSSSKRVTSEEIWFTMQGQLWNMFTEDF
jgi:hypothetical protein